MKKPAAEVVAAAEGRPNLVPLRRSPLPSLPLSATRTEEITVAVTVGFESEITRKGRKDSISVKCGGYRIKLLRGTVSTQTGLPHSDPFAVFQGVPETVAGWLASSVWLDQGWVGCANLVGAR
jgi:hypothetical protein